MSTASVDDLKALLDPRAVLSALGISYRGRGDELYTKNCPACGQRTRETVEIHATEGMWRCYRCRGKGSIYDLIRGFAGLDSFRAAVERAAEIAGVDVSLQISPELVAERRRKAAERRAADEARAAEMRARMPELWAECSERSLTGETYLKDRGIDPRKLRHVLRYLKGYAPALPLRDLATGEVVGIQSRTPAANAEPKSPMLEGSCARGAALWGRVTDLDPDGVDVAVLVEGVADTLVAHLTWPGCAIYGAPGWEQLASIASAVAPRVAACRGSLLIVPHLDPDDQGATGAAEAIRACVDAGLTLAPPDAGLDGASTVRLVDLGEHKDLADAYRAGWRWLWPAPRSAS